MVRVPDAAQRRRNRAQPRQHQHLGAHSVELVTMGLMGSMQDDIAGTHPHSSAIARLDICARENHRSEGKVVPMTLELFAGGMAQPTDVRMHNAFAAHEACVSAAPWGGSRMFKTEFAPAN